MESGSSGTEAATPGFDIVTGESAGGVEGAAEAGASVDRLHAPRKMNRTHTILMVDVSATHRDAV
jgi:hypothetical protein